MAELAPKPEVFDEDEVNIFLERVIHNLRGKTQYIRDLDVSQFKVEPILHKCRRQGKEDLILVFRIKSQDQYIDPESKVGEDVTNALTLAGYHAGLTKKGDAFGLRVESEVFDNFDKNKPLPAASPDDYGHIDIGNLGI
ncbi:hypothetical protein ACFL10_01690 [Patescibacteria group bacterium]